jgi:uroporphyrinogen-III decarboxylase
MLKQEWAGRLSLVGSFPTQLLGTGSQDEIEETVRRACATLAPGGGYALSSSLGTFREIPPRNYVTMVQAVHKYGRYGALGAKV